MIVAPRRKVVTVKLNVKMKGNFIFYIDAGWITLHPKEEMRKNVLVDSKKGV